MTHPHSSHGMSASGGGAANYNKRFQVQQSHARAVAEGRLVNMGQRLKPLDFRSAQHIRPDDCFAFQAAAESFNLFVLVRATNRHSLKYIGQRGFAPKAMDCKAKTCQMDVAIGGVAAMSKCAGLVVNPFLSGVGAFENVGSFTKAQNSWRDFQSLFHWADGPRQVFPRSTAKGFYAVDVFPGSERYGCLMVSEQDIPTGATAFDLSSPAWQGWKNTHMRYIHGDYDLYGCIDPDAPNAAPLTSEQFDLINVFSQGVPNVAMFVNNWMGVDMVQHGEQFHLEHSNNPNEPIYVFAPSGGMYVIPGADGRTMADIFKRVLGVVG